MCFNFKLLLIAKLWVHNPYERFLQWKQSIPCCQNPPTYLFRADKQCVNCAHLFPDSDQMTFSLEKAI